MKKWAFIFILLPLWASAQWQLSDKGEIHIVTCGPYQGELYSAFGHSAIRVSDPEAGIDLIYNYGIFDYNQPHFYLNFAKGFLKYRVAVNDYRPFRDFYISENRYIHEQVLNLSPGEKQQLFDFLQWNSRPENMHYYYDYFYDNCATRVRDAVAQTFGDQVEFDGSYVTTKYTIRDLCDLYLQQQPWGDLGIDLCLGLPMDKEASPYEYMFLPDYIEAGFNHASLMKDGKKVPLVKETILTYQARPEQEPTQLFTPFMVFTLLLLFGLWLTYRGYRRGRGYFGFDVALLTITGLLGWLFFVLWFFTDHAAAAQNFNLLWAIPLHFPLAWLLLRKHKLGFLRTYFRMLAVLHAFTLLSWAFLPQELHYALIPLVVLLLVRAIFIQQRIGLQPRKEVAAQA